ncbi:S-adenosyl-L-methionine-dependent methyltransferase [Mycena kentingensis (nom. inval.)]|nr:S-adenosyl-L-methionine-dependent methyltransferase [Mycena kentingensis (nom. inval.)]
MMLPPIDAAAMSPHLLQLDKPSLLFFPAQSLTVAGASNKSASLTQPSVAQIIVRSEKRYPTRAEVATFYDAQEDITAAIETLVFSDLARPYARKEVEIEGEGYVLVGEKIRWTFGQQYSFKWGQQQVQTNDVKWVFKFRTGAFDAEN